MSVFVRQYTCVGGTSRIFLKLEGYKKENFRHKNFACI